MDLASSSDRIAEIAAFLLESVDVAGARPPDIVRIVRDRWLRAPDDEIEQAVSIALELRLARLAAEKSELQTLIEKSRLLFGARTTATMLLKYA